jgi:phosphatidylethanolamine/phosphatidyl-N-methylethanolamine N-methyltransferase
MHKKVHHEHASLSTRLGDSVLFMVEFFKHPRRIGVPTQSPRSIAETVRQELKAHGARRVVELGAGLGVLTSGILQAIPPDAKLLCLEREPAFCRRLAKRFNGRVQLLNADALDLPRILAGTQWEHPDAIVCSVPLVGDFAMQLTGMIAEVLPPDGLYLQVANLRGAVEAFFEVQKTYLYLDSVPPEHLHRAVHK